MNSIDSLPMGHFQLRSLMVNRRITRNNILCLQCILDKYDKFTFQLNGILGRRFEFLLRFPQINLQMSRNLLKYWPDIFEVKYWSSVSPMLPLLWTAIFSRQEVLMFSPFLYVNPSLARRYRRDIEGRARRRQTGQKEKARPRQSFGLTVVAQAPASAHLKWPGGPWLVQKETDQLPSKALQIVVSNDRLEPSLSGRSAHHSANDPSACRQTGLRQR